MDPRLRYSLWPVSQNLLYTFQSALINITLFISWSFLWLVIHRAFALSFNSLIQVGPNIVLYHWKWSSVFWKAEGWKSHQICKMWRILQMLTDVTFSSDFLLETSPATFGDVCTIGEGKGIEETPQCLLAHLLPVSFWAPPDGSHEEKALRSLSFS